MVRVINKNIKWARLKKNSKKKKHYSWRPSLPNKKK